MANGNTHRLAAALTVGSVLGYVDAENKESTARPLVGAGAFLIHLALDALTKRSLPLIVEG